MATEKKDRESAEVFWSRQTKTVAQYRRGEDTVTCFLASLNDNEPTVEC